jgi:uncharacterized protein
LPAWLNVSIFGITQFFMLAGLLGLVVPVFPGLVVMWLAALGFGIIHHFDTPGIVIFVLITILMLVGSVIDNFVMGAGARKGGAAWLSIGVALAAGVIFTLIFPPIGGIIAAPLAVLLLEYARRRDWQKAWQALRGLAAGWGLAYAIRLVIGFLMMALWWFWVWQK